MYVYHCMYCIALIQVLNGVQIDCELRYDVCPYSHAYIESRIPWPSQHADMHAHTHTQISIKNVYGRAFIRKHLINIRDVNKVSDDINF